MTYKRHARREILKIGDSIALASEGHGSVMLESMEMIEVKQGPYSGDNDKTRLRK